MTALRWSKPRQRIKPLTHDGLEHQILQIHPLGKTGIPKDRKEQEVGMEFVKFLIKAFQTIYFYHIFLSILPQLSTHPTFMFSLSPSRHLSQKQKQLNKNQNKLKNKLGKIPKTRTDPWSPFCAGHQLQGMGLRLECEVQGPASQETDFPFPAGVSKEVPRLEASLWVRSPFWQGFCLLRACVSLGCVATV